MTESVSTREVTLTSPVEVIETPSPIFALEAFFWMFSASAAATCMLPSFVCAFGRSLAAPVTASVLTFFVPICPERSLAACVFLSAIWSASPSLNSARMSSPLPSSGYSPFLIISS